MKKCLFLLGLALMLNGMVSLCHAGVTWGNDVRLTEEKHSSGSGFVVVDAQNNIHVFWSDTRDMQNNIVTSEIYYKRSPDGGKTWGEDTRLSVSQPNSAQSPVAAVDSFGRVHVIWQVSYDIKTVYKRSLDGGVTWEDEVVISDGWASQMAVDSFGRVHAIWLAHPNRSGDFNVYYRRSLNGGETWEEEVPMTLIPERDPLNPDQIIRNALTPAIAVDNENRVHAVWVEHRSRDIPPPDWDIDIYYNRSLDGGETWESEEGARLTWREVENITAVSIATDSLGGVHLAWEDTGDSGNLSYKEIYSKHSLDGGDHWGEDTRLTMDPADSYSPRITTDSLGRVYVVWGDKREGNTEIYSKISLDRGQTWGNDTSLTMDDDIVSGNPSITIDSQDRPHLVWTDLRNRIEGRNDNSEIYYKKGRYVSADPLLPAQWSLGQR